jgi:hypothetical protein
VRDRSTGARGFARLYTTSEPLDSVATTSSDPSSLTAMSPRVRAPETITESTSVGVAAATSQM